MVDSPSPKADISLITPEISGFSDAISFARPTQPSVLYASAAATVISLRLPTTILMPSVKSAVIRPASWVALSVSVDIWPLSVSLWVDMEL